MGIPLSHEPQSCLRALELAFSSAFSSLPSPVHAPQASPHSGLDSSATFLIGSFPASISGFLPPTPFFPCSSVLRGPDRLRTRNVSLALFLGPFPTLEHELMRAGSSVARDDPLLQNNPKESHLVRRAPRFGCICEQPGKSEAGARAGP